MVCKLHFSKFICRRVRMEQENNNKPIGNNKTEMQTYTQKIKKRGQQKITTLVRLPQPEPKVGWEEKTDAPLKENARPNSIHVNRAVHEWLPTEDRNSLSDSSQPPRKHQSCK